MIKKQFGEKTRQVLQETAVSANDGLTLIDDTKPGLHLTLFQKWVAKFQAENERVKRFMKFGELCALNLMGVRSSSAQQTPKVENAAASEEVKQVSKVSSIKVCKFLNFYVDFVQMPESEKAKENNTGENFGPKLDFSDELEAV